MLCVCELERWKENRVIIRNYNALRRQLVIMKNVVHYAERDVSGLSEAGKQCDTQWVRKVRRRLSRIASFVNRTFVQESVCALPLQCSSGLIY